MRSVIAHCREEFLKSNARERGNLRTPLTPLERIEMPSSVNFKPDIINPTALTTEILGWQQGDPRQQACVERTWNPGEILAWLIKGSIQQNIDAVKNCSELYGTLELSRFNETAIALTRPGEGLGTLQVYNRYCAPFATAVGMGLALLAASNVKALMSERFASWLRPEHWMPRNMAGKSAQPTEYDTWREAQEIHLSLDERRANRQYDDALSLTRKPNPDRPLADIEIARALVVHLSNTPQDTDLKSHRVTQLCALLAHGLGFSLDADYAKSIFLDTHPHTLIQHNDSFALLHALLAPDWEHDKEGAPTFSVHPVDVQLFDPEETTSDLLAPYRAIDDDSASPDSSATRAREIRESRERLTDKAALERVRSRVVTGIAASVRHECDRTPLGWRVTAKIELIIATSTDMTYGEMLERLGVAVMGDISVRGYWRWDGDPPDDEYGPAPASMPEHVAKWLVRVLASEPELPDMTDTQTSSLAASLTALARMDTPASLGVGSPEWNDLVKGVEIIGERHWYASFAQVCHAGRTGEVPPFDAPGGDDGNPPDQPGPWRKKPPRSSKSRHRRTQR
ncbi:hypothetical protein [Pandoraea pneumonica]|nr:hypothetical protein [Pandoraea pneumonica]